MDWRKDDKIVTTVIEHHSNFITWLRVGNRYRCKVSVVRATSEGVLDLGEFEKTIDDKTKIVAVTGVSNVLGVIVPVKEIAKIAHEHRENTRRRGPERSPH
jgi:cysteine desulfurase / selenocysteine lyase